jgi:hypothetical protein
MTERKRRRTKTGALSDEAVGLLFLLSDIREAVGDPTGKLMQDELIEHCRKLNSSKLRLESALKNLLRRHEEWEIAGYAIERNEP